MTAQPALKDRLKDVHQNEIDEIQGDIPEQAYDEDLHRRFIDWKDLNNKSLTMLSRMLNLSTAAISGYINQKYKGKVGHIETAIKNLLDREEDQQYVIIPDKFQNTHTSKLMWEVLQFCDVKGKMGVVLAPSGSGKTETCKEYKSKNRGTVFATADISTRRVGAVLRLLARCIGGIDCRSISDTLHNIIGRMKGSKRLIIIDDAHFLTWEAYEAVRKIHDCAGVGVVYCGQPRLYDEMRGADNKAYLYDQIYSRIAIKRDKFNISRDDVKKIARGMFPVISDECVDYLFAKAKQKGRFRLMSNLLDVALESSRTNELPLTVDVLMEASKFLKVE